MYLVYYDESGDDGYPQFSSPLFVLSGIMVHMAMWQQEYERLRSFRQRLTKKYKFPLKWEIHTKELLLNKGDYRSLSLSGRQRVAIIEAFVNEISRLDVRIVNVVINKHAIQRGDYGVLDSALSYSIQRMENDLSNRDPTAKFLVITDEGRVGKMRSTSRRIQRGNFVPSHFGGAVNRKITRLLEDPLPKDSGESYFLQACDCAAYIVYMHKLLQLGVGNLAGRIPPLVNSARLDRWLRRLEPVLNLKASKTDRFGIVVYPK